MKWWQNMLVLKYVKKSNFIYIITQKKRGKNLTGYQLMWSEITANRQDLEFHVVSK